MPSGNDPTLDLSGPWKLYHAAEPPAGVRRAADLAAAGLEPIPATVPGNVELDLVAAGRLPEPFVGMDILRLRELEGMHWFYVRRFCATRRAGHEAVLRFGGIDCFASIFLDGVRVAETANMLIEHVVPIQAHLTDDEQEHELLVHIRPAVIEAAKHLPPPGHAMSASPEAVRVRKAPHMYGWDIMPRAVSAGLWRDVRVWYRPSARIGAVQVRTVELNADHGRAVLWISAELAGVDFLTGRWTLEAAASCDDSAARIVVPVRFLSTKLDLPIDRPRLWWPRGRGPQHLYRLQLTLRDGERIAHTAEFHIGVRTIELLRTSTTDDRGSGEFVFKVNGEKTFILGTNWVPADAFHSRDASRIPRMLDLAEEIGCNLLRCWGGNVYEDEAFFDACDRRGILVWQDFAMACAIYPRDAAFSAAMADEVRAVVRRIRNHACLAIYAGDNECDQAHSWLRTGMDPNDNTLTRVVIPEVLRQEDPGRPYLPSSPYIDPEGFAAGEPRLTEQHLWGPRDYYKGDFYRLNLAHFASEIGYHGCPSPESIRRFISPDKLWPPMNNDQWLLHSTSPVPELHLYDYRVELMLKQVRELFGTVPDNLEDFAFASQASQAEAMKFFIERFRTGMWRRTGIVWWNLIDGWPQFSDAVVDYFFGKKLAFDVIRRLQQPICLSLTEPDNWRQTLVACNNTRQDQELRVTIHDVESDDLLLEAADTAGADRVTPLGSIDFTHARQRMLRIDWTLPDGTKARNHHLAGHPPFDLAWYRTMLTRSGLNG